MNSRPHHTARGSRVRLTIAVAAAVVTAMVALIITQTAVTGEEKHDSSQFTVAGNGDLPTKRPDLGDSREPLSTQETGYAIHLASTDRSIPAAATNVLGESGPEFLYADVPQDVDTTGRKAVVVLYDYTTNTAYQQTVNLKTSAVTSAHSQGAQPPPSPEEAIAAVKLVIAADPPLPAATQFEELEGVPLVSPDQVSYVAGTWIYDKTTTGGKSCGAERCAQLIIKTPAGVYLESTNVVVNLSKRKVVALGAAS